MEVSLCQPLLQPPERLAQEFLKSISPSAGQSPKIPPPQKSSAKMEENGLPFRLRAVRDR
jgi:hypothetical protein